MRNYIKAELYRSFNRMYFWGSTAVMGAIALLFNGILLYFKAQGATQVGFGNVLQTGITLFIVPAYLVIIFVDLVASEEQKHLTLKNAIASGLSRSKAFLGKVITEVFLAFISAGIILTVYLGSAFILFGIGNSINIEIVIDFCIRLTAVVPIWISLIAGCTILAMFIKNNTIFAIIYGFGVGFIPTVLQLLSMFFGGIFTILYNYFPTIQIDRVSRASSLKQEVVLTCIGIGMIYTLIFVVIGMICMQRKTID